MGLSLNRFFKIYAILLLTAFLFFLNSYSQACSRTEKSAEAAFRTAVLQDVEKNPEWNSYQLKEITNKLNVYTVILKSGSKRKTLKFKAVGKSDCKVEVTPI